MKKRFIFLTAAILFTANAMAFDFTLNLSANYNLGTSSFFDKSERFLSYDGQTFLQEHQNKMGLGIGASINIPILKRLTLIPAFNVNVGHHNYNYEGLSSSQNDESNTYFFIIYSGELNLEYDFLKFKNGLELFVLAGLNYNIFKADAQMNLEESKYIGMLSGLGLKFFGTKHFGFQVLGYYRMPLKKETDKDPLSFVGLKAGILFKF